MEAYSDFARVYDIFMDNVEYEKWAEYLIESLKEYGIEDGIVLELGCGTGVMTELLAESGYDMIGVDNSEEMLGEAMEKRAESGHEILYLEQDMREFELYGTVRAVVSVCDCMNYITEEDDRSGEQDRMYAGSRNDLSLYLQPGRCVEVHAERQRELFLYRCPGKRRTSSICEEIF